VKLPLGEFEDLGDLPTREKLGDGADGLLERVYVVRRIPKQRQECPGFLIYQSEITIILHELATGVAVEFLLQFNGIALFVHRGE
jgi:hypothetical protein